MGGICPSPLTLRNAGFGPVEGEREREREREREKSLWLVYRNQLYFAAKTLISTEYILVRLYCCLLLLYIMHRIPGRLNDRRTPLGELNWIFTAVTDTIAWNTLPRGK